MLPYKRHNAVLRPADKSSDWESLPMFYTKLPQFCVDKQLLDIQQSSESTSTVTAAEGQSDVSNSTSRRSLYQQHLTL